MKNRFKLFGISLLFIFFAVSSCNIFSNDESTSCDDTKMESAEEPTIYIRTIIPYTPALLESSPVKVGFTGSISKIFCSGEGGSQYAYDPYFLVDSTTFAANKSNLTLPQAYQFKFENTQDRLVTECKVKVYLEDGSVYESDKITGYYFFEDLQFDEEDLQYYLVLEPTSLKWFEVNGTSN